MAIALPRLACRTNVTFSRFLTRRSVKRARSARHAWSDCAHQIVDTFSKQYSPTIEDNFVNTILKNIWDFFALLPLRLGIEQKSGWEIDFFSPVGTLVPQSKFSAFPFSNVSLKWYQILSILYFCFNPLSTNITIQILYTLPERISWENLIKQRVFISWLFY